ncbi:MAG: DUF3298 and DUF4163 domain-containing protein [Muribaculum sp.]|nr:DUF3298 and DUF4163 domain-containing protein [Muribaculaceae bacterium]MCM1080678.1 DUF3298 and DUF4163 domain-containing protein [Muribaculum sp.]
MKLLNSTFLASIALLATTACSGNKSKTAANEISQAFTTDSASYADSIQVGKIKATASVDLLYPTSGNQATVDSVNSWINDQLNIRNHTFTNATDVAKYAVKLQLDSTSAEISPMAKEYPDYQTEYETNLMIGKAFENDKVITLFSTAYIYTGGAHGSTLYNNASFQIGNGQQLGWNMFKPESMPELTLLIKKEIMNQYFKADEEKGIDYLLVKESEFPLPKTQPAMFKDGISFTYQQYEIAAYAAGMPNCTIPYSELKQFFAPGIEQFVPTK